MWLTAGKYIPHHDPCQVEKDGWCKECELHTDIQIPSILSNSFLDLCKCTEFRMVAWQITHQILQGFRDLHLAHVLKIYVMLLMYVSKETLMSQLCFRF